MAKMGLELPKYCLIEGENEILGMGKTMAKAIKADIKINIHETKIHADNNIDESLKEFKDGAITQEINDLLDGVASDLLGQKIDTDGVLTASGNDVAPFNRVGFIVRNQRQNVVSYMVIVLMKVQYGIPDESFETRGDNIAFKSVTIVGSIFRNKDDDWKKQKTFSTKTEAVEWLDLMLNVGTLTVSSIAGSTTGKTKLTVSPVKKQGNSYKYITGATVVLPDVGKTLLDSKYTPWDGVVEISATTAHEICVVEIDAQNIVVCCGKSKVQSKV